MKYSANMLWAVPYVEGARHLFKAHRVTKVTGWKTRPNTTLASDGSCSKANGWYQVSIRVTELSGRPLNKEDALFFLAHELAHTEFWEHDVRHLGRLSKIMTCFSQTAAALKIKDTQESLQKTR